MRRAHKIRLVPNATQTVLLNKTAGTSRYVYNWAVQRWEELYKSHKENGTEKPTAYMLSRTWTVEKPRWVSETARYAQTEAILNVGKAYINFWKHIAAKPSFKKKGEHDSFQASCEKVKISGNRIYLPMIGWIKMREELRLQGKVYGITVSHHAGQWHVSIQVEMPDQPKKVNPSVVGVDVGIKSIAVASDGTRCDNPKFLKTQEGKLKRAQRRLARQNKNSKRSQRTKLAIAKLHQHIANQRKDVIHKFTSTLSKNHGTAVIEMLDIEGMKDQGKPWLNRLLQDTAMREVHTQLGYKMTAVVKAPPRYPSSKTCSSCGNVKVELPCSVRVYRCDKCGTVKDRDVNAAENLKNMRWVTA